MKNNNITIGVCEGRHNMPCTNFVFGTEVNPLETSKLEALACEKLASLVKEADLWTYKMVPSEDAYCDSRTARVLKEGVELTIYVTGLTVALIAVINAAISMGFAKVVLMHYDRESGNYYPQKIETKKSLWIVD